jgi:hypothetical protein
MKLLNQEEDCDAVCKLWWRLGRAQGSKETEEDGTGGGGEAGRMKRRRRRNRFPCWKRIRKYMKISLKTSEAELYFCFVVSLG